VQISDVHLRYEDDFSCPLRPFAFGFFIESLSAQVKNKCFKKCEKYVLSTIIQNLTN
jgi:hypothetical protein